MSRNKKKNKVVRLSETDYDNYIMSLKEEKPTKVIVSKEDYASDEE